MSAEHVKPEIQRHQQQGGHHPLAASTRRLQRARNQFNKQGRFWGAAFQAAHSLISIDCPWALANNVSERMGGGDPLACTNILVS